MASIQDAGAPPNYNLSWFIVEAFTSVLKPLPIEVLPSKVAYRRRPSGGLLWYQVVAGVMVSVGLAAVYGGAWLENIALTIGSFTIPLTYLLWFTQNDRYEPEPATLVAYLFGWGAIAGLLSMYLNPLLYPFLGTGGAALIEEPLKLFGVYLLAKGVVIRSEINSHLDGLVYGAAAGAGFASLENISYLLTAGGGFGVSQAMLQRSTVSFSHMAWTAIGARTIGLANAVRGEIRLTDMLPGLLIVVPLHFVWNSFGSMVRSWFIAPVTVLILFRELSMAMEDEARWGYENVAPDEKKVRRKHTLGGLRFRRKT